MGFPYVSSSLLIEQAISNPFIAFIFLFATGGLLAVLEPALDRYVKWCVDDEEKK